MLWLDSHAKESLAVRPKCDPSVACMLGLTLPDVCMCVCVSTATVCLSDCWHALCAAQVQPGSRQCVCAMRLGSTHYRLCVCHGPAALLCVGHCYAVVDLLRTFADRGRHLVATGRARSHADAAVQADSGWHLQLSELGLVPVGDHHRLVHSDAAAFDLPRAHSAVLPPLVEHAALLSAVRRIVVLLLGRYCSACRFAAADRRVNDVSARIPGRAARRVAQRPGAQFA
jgi:hypothetical protein